MMHHAMDGKKAQPGGPLWALPAYTCARLALVSRRGVERRSVAPAHVTAIRFG